MLNSTSLKTTDTVLLTRLKRPQIIFDGVLGLGYLVLVVFSFGTVSIQLLSAVVLAVAMSFRRRSPGLALGMAWLAATMQMAFGTVPGVIESGILLVLFASTAYGSQRTRRLSGISVIVGTILATAYMVGPTSGVPVWEFENYRDPLLNTAEFRMLIPIIVVFLLALVSTWLAGLLRRNIIIRQQQSQARELAEVEVIAEQERTRIARDMHDVVAHSLTVVVAQADGARYLAKTDLKQTEEALETIAETARDALSQVRVLLAELRHRQEPGPQPGIDELHELFERFRLAGLRLHGTGTFSLASQLTTDQQRALYRIIQESLTNALRHGDVAEPVQLHCERDNDRLRIRMSNRLRSDFSGFRPGHGLIGMTERAALVGAELQYVQEANQFVIMVHFFQHGERIS